jgi:hypothetical protein
LAFVIEPRDSGLALISLHLPKTAGTSFSASLAEHFGERYRGDYEDAAISMSPQDRGVQALRAGLQLADHGLGEVDCIHGHFLPVKYLLLSTRAELVFITWMRDPLARMLSHFHYWQQNYDEATAAPHHRRFIEERWTLEKFCLSDKFRNIYTQYLWGFPFENFSFIGISEHYAEDFRQFADRYLGVEMEPQQRNVSRGVAAGRLLDPGLAAEVRDFHAADLALYRRALLLRQQRMHGAPASVCATSSQ